MTSEPEDKLDAAAAIAAAVSGPGRDTITIGTAGTANKPDETDYRLTHANCHHGTRPGTLPAQTPETCLSRMR